MTMSSFAHQFCAAVDRPEVPMPDPFEWFDDICRRTSDQEMQDELAFLAGLLMARGVRPRQPLPVPTEEGEGRVA